MRRVSCLVNPWAWLPSDGGISAGLAILSSIQSFIGNLFLVFSFVLIHLLVHTVRSVQPLSIVGTQKNACFQRTEKGPQRVI